MKAIAILCAMGLWLAWAIQTPAAVKYWTNNGGDSKWSAATNWNGGVPASGDTAYFRDVGLADVPQTIDLDVNTSISNIACTATGNRSITINTSNGSTITFMGGSDITGAGRGVTLTINPNMFYDADTFNVERETQHVVLNGNILPLPPFAGSYMNVNDTGILTVRGSNVFIESSYAFRNNNAGEIVAGGRYALGSQQFRNVTAGGVLSLETSVVVGGNFFASGDMDLRLKNAGTNDVMLTIQGQCSTAKVTVQPSVASTGHLTIQCEALGATRTHTASWALTNFCTLRLYADATGQHTWGTPTDPTSAAISGPGNVEFDGTGLFYMAPSNTYTGGTTIRGGDVRLSTTNGFPTNGNVMVYSGGIFDLNGKPQTVAGFSGNGTLDLWSSVAATITVANAFAPGVNAAGTLSVTGKGQLILGPSSTSTFELSTLAGTSDKVVYNNASGNLTLGGTLQVVNLGGLQAGQYTLFDLFGGTVSGSFSATNMPLGFTGAVSVSGGDVVLTVTANQPNGTSFMIR